MGFFIITIFFLPPSPEIEAINAPLFSTHPSYYYFLFGAATSDTYHNTNSFVLFIPSFYNCYLDYASPILPIHELEKLAMFGTRVLRDSGTPGGQT